MNKRNAVPNTNKLAFIRKVCEVAGIKVVSANVREARGIRVVKRGFGWTRAFNNGWKTPVVLERSRVVFRTEDEALANAHAHYRLRVA